MMGFRQISCFILSAVGLLCLASCGNQTAKEMETVPTKLPQTQNSIVRLSKIEVYPEYLEEYKAFATEVGEVSLRTEAGVLAMYGMAEKENPCRITILEIYADTASYKTHIASAHFQKYKTGTLKMVKSLELEDQDPMNPKMRLQQLHLKGAK